MLSTFKRMSSGDMFTGKRESAIARSKVREIFTPSKPVTMMECLLGRDSHIGRLIEILNTPGQHALLFGDRGVGKSSLANVTSIIIKLHEYFDPKQVYYKICGSEDTFESILQEPLRKAGVDIQITEYSISHKQKGAAKVSALVANADIESLREESHKRRPTLTVSSVAQTLRNAKGLLIVDEADALKDDSDKKKIAELIKLLSDTGSGFKIMVVGIAATGTQLIAGHKSVERCLGEVKLDRLAAPELWKIIQNGQQKIKGHRLEFDHDVINSIVAISNGYPYFTHLLALKCAEEAIVAGRYTVRKEHLIEATMIAAEGAEGALRSAYQEATRSYAANGDLYRVILLAAAKMQRHEFSARELRDEVCKIWGKPLSQSSLSNFYATLISESSESILRRVSKGIYCFNDPRMPSFIRIVNSAV